MSKKTHWRRVGSNCEDIRTREEKARDRRKAFYDWLEIDRMKVNKPKFKRAVKRVDPTEE